MFAATKGITTVEEKILLSLSRSELESIIIGCVTACLKSYRLPIASATLSKYVTASEAADLINCSRRKIDMCAAAGEIERHKIGRKTQYLRSEILKLVKPVNTSK